jgi:glycosyltransferase involved in cell wall biosynthesis
VTNKNHKPRFTVIVPCYNEQEAIQDTVVALRTYLGDQNSYELIVVNDGSSDHSPKLLDLLSHEQTNLRVLHHDQNRGYGAALKTGIRHAKTELIVITDADGTYPNERIPELVELAADADMVVGSRTGENVRYSPVRAFPKMFLRRYASWIARQSIPDINSGLRIFRKSVAEKFLNILPNNFSFTLTITLAMLTNYYVVAYLPIDYSQRIGKSKIRPIRDTLRFVEIIIRTGMYFAPLRVFFPIILLLTVGFVASLSYDVFILQDLTEKTILFLLFSMNTAMFALLADMIDKRISR